MKHTILTKIYLIHFSLLTAGTICTAANETEKTNLLFIITDQQRFDALGIAGKYDFLETPNLDKLAREGAWFTNAYAPCAVCAPSRTSILTGLSVENHKVKTNDLAYDNTKALVRSFDQVLADHGYYSEYWGKFHSPIHLSDAYQEFGYALNEKNGRYTLDDKIRYKSILDQESPYEAPKEGELKDNFFKRSYIPDPIDMRYGKGEDFRRTLPNGTVKNITQPDNHGKLNLSSELSLTAYQTQCAIDGIKRATNKDAPFNITVSYFFPHAPMLPTEPWYSMYSPDDMPVPASISDPMNNSPYPKANGRNYMTEYANPSKIKYMMSNYFGLVSEIDFHIGKLLEQLETNGFIDNTLIIFTSDHGEMLGSHGMREKNVFYEESAHIPLIIWQPGKISPQRIDRYVSLIDLYPTILDYTIGQAADRDGKSLRGLMEETNTEHGNYVVTEWDYHGPSQPNYMVVSDGWKMITSYGNESSETHALYNLIDDPYEMNNLIGSNPNANNYIEETDELREYLVEWLQHIGSARVDEIKTREIVSGHIPSNVETHSENRNRIMVRPIAAKDAITIETTKINEEVSIHNTYGIEVDQFHTTGKDVLNISNWPSGVYIISADNCNAVKFIKH